MHRRRQLTTIALLALCAAGCHKKPPVTVPPIAPENPPPPPPPPPPPRASTSESADAATRAVRLEFEGNLIHFEFDKSDIMPEDRAVLDRKADIMKANPAVRIRISGHADERGSDEYNLVLGNKRAEAAKAYLQARGIDGARVDITSYGEERPADRASTEEAWAKNRRDEFEIVAGGNQLVRPR